MSVDDAIAQCDYRHSCYGGVKAIDICKKYNVNYDNVKRRMYRNNLSFKQALISFFKDEPEKIKEIKETIPETKD